MGMQSKNFSDLITFTRASGGTSFRPVGYGPELVVNGGPFVNSTGWSPFNGAALSVASGSLRVTNGNYGGATFVTTATVGKAYRVRIVRSGGTATSYRGTLLGVVTNLNAWETSVVVTATSNQTTFYINSGVAGETLDISSYSVQEVILDRAGDPIQLFTAPNNVPRIDYDPVTGACKGLLIEEQRTNYRHVSDNFSTFIRRNNIPVSTDHAAIAPHGETAGPPLHQTTAGPLPQTGAQKGPKPHPQTTRGHPAHKSLWRSAPPMA